MVIYVEYFLIDNMVIDMILLYLMLITVRERASFFRMLLSSAVGTAFAFGLPFIPSFVFLYSAAAAVLMILVLPHKSVKSYFKKLFVFVGFSFFLGGVVMGLLNFSSSDISGAVVYEGRVIISATLIGVLLFFLLIRWLYINKKQNIVRRYHYRTKIKIGGVVKELVGYYDSGNKLYDTHDGTPAAVISRDIADEILNQINPDIYMLDIHTVSGKNSLKAFKVDKFWIYFGKEMNIIENMTIAVSVRDFNGFKVLLHNEHIKI